jgi:acetyl-CoA carboxylase carboxyl transferase subunit beta
MGDWCSDLLADVTFSGPTTIGRNVISWPGYTPLPAVLFGEGAVAGRRLVACVWDFATYGGSLGEAEAATVAAAVTRAIEVRLPLLTVVRTGGTRLQEGVAALIGIARSSVALDDLAAAGLPHVSIADHPTTGGVWVSVVSRADIRAGIRGATVGFSGPSVIAAMTGEHVSSDANTAESAAAAGLLDAVLDPGSVGDWLSRVLAATSADSVREVALPPSVPPPATSGWAQVQRCRTCDRAAGAELLDVVLDDAVVLGAADAGVRAVVGRSAANRRTVAVAFAATRDTRPGPVGFALLARAATLADRLGYDLCTFVDTPGADPLPDSENSGLAPAIEQALSAMLTCRAVTLAVVHGEGGSGGALAATVADRVLVTTNGYFTALAPEGAATALHTTPEAAADRGAVAPADLRRLGFADDVVSAEPQVLRDVVAATLTVLAALPQQERLAARRDRWRGPLPGRC